MTMKFLLHKDKKENIEIASVQMAHLGFAFTQPNTEKSQKSDYMIKLD